MKTYYLVNMIGGAVIYVDAHKAQAAAKQAKTDVVKIVG